MCAIEKIKVNNTVSPASVNKSEDIMTKISIRFFNDRKVRAAWDESSSQWFFAAVDIVAVLNEQSDYTKANNYWRWLKRKLKQENPQLVSATH
ncbi:MAG: hypothetical protein IKB16_02585, partial [Lentisphaeria bacterium]|nr:hypothetical protein [Lentisphaeria bacterium]